MNFKIVAVGGIKEKYFTQAIEEYVKRLSRFGKTEIVEVQECLFKGEPSPKDVENIVRKEGVALLERCEGFVVALDIDGVQLSSEELSQKLSAWKQRNSRFTFLIGGSHGLSDEVLRRADFRLSFGRITLPHQLCRVVLCEQLYRTCSIESNMPYHK